MLAQLPPIFPPVLILVLCVVAGIATLMMLPGRRERLWGRIGAVIGAAAGLIFMALLIRYTAGPGQSDGLGPYFWIFSGIAIASAVRVITHPRPVYSALYFVLTVLASAGLFILLWAEFMAAALVVIYAGAILVTYVFVIMLAQQASKPEQLAESDTVSHDPLLATAIGFVLAGVLLFVIFDKADRLGGKAANAAVAAAVPTTRPTSAPANVAIAPSSNPAPTTRTVIAASNPAPTTNAAVIASTKPATTNAVAVAATSKPATTTSAAVAATSKPVAATNPTVAASSKPATNATVAATSKPATTTTVAVAASKPAITAVAKSASAPATTTAAAAMTTRPVATAPAVVATAPAVATTSPVVATTVPAVVKSVPASAKPKAKAAPAAAKPGFSGTTQELGYYLFNNQIVNLELAGLILTVAMVGAILIARRKVVGTQIVEPGETPSISTETISASATPVDDNPHSIPVYGTRNPRNKAWPES